MGATTNLGLPWPELPAQADGPAAFQALATAVEAKMTNNVSSAAWGIDMNTHVAPGAQVNIFSQDVAAAVVGWAWIDVNIAIAVGGPQGGRFPVTVVQNAGGQIFIMQGTTLLRGLRWHSRQRAEMFWVSGGAPLQIPLALTVLPVRIVMSTDSTSDAYGADAYEVNVGITQFGAPRG